MEQAPFLEIALVGAAVIVASLIAAVFKSLRLPALVGYLILGFLIRWADTHWHFLSESAHATFSFLAEVGLIILLFTIGLKSDVRGLVQKLPRASLLWVGNVAAAGAAGFIAAFYVLSLDLIPSLVVAAALTATSVGVSLAAWQEANALESSNGEILLDVAELDDISGVALMALLLAVIPALQQGDASVWATVRWEAAVFFVKLVLFTLFCLAFARLFEGRLVRASERIEPQSGVMLIVFGMGLLIAAGAGWLGFSLAIGALFAGLVFSRDPEVARVEPAIDPLHAFFAPFFFINIGLQVAPTALVRGWDLGLVLLAAAVIGKLVGTALPGWRAVGGCGAILIGVSMVPRAEVAMIVIEQGRQIGPHVVPEPVYAAVVLVAVATSLLAPALLRPLLSRWPQRNE